VLAALPGAALAAEAPESAPSAPARPLTLEERLARLEADNASLRAALTGAEARLADLEGTTAELRRGLLPGALEVPDLVVADGVHLRLNGYVDAGFFDAGGDGVAYFRDAGNVIFPELSKFTWVFVGDPWSNPVNSQGDSADLGLDRTNIPRYDPIASGGKPSFILNMVNLSIVASAGKRLVVEASLDFEPRQGTLGSPGDTLNMDLAYLEWIPFDKIDLHVFVGKFDSNFGIEYRRRKAPDAFGVTPSIIARYTTGPMTGVKVRGALGGLFIYNVAVTNGSSFTERFAHFYDEIDANAFKTLSGRLSLRTPASLPFSLEVGGSGMFGAQDEQPDDGILQWQVGVDLNLVVRDLEIRAEYLHARADGGGIKDAPWLRADGWYASATYQLFPWLGVLARVDQRRARLFASPNLYVTNTLRLTGGLRFDLTFNVIAKVEYVHLFELGTPEFFDDVFTSSLIFKF
jgi:hypothetical protein